jgi:cobalamin biosynthesis protein CobD/CbiB
VTRFERWAVWSTSVATFVTGVIYLWMKYLVVSDDPLAVVNHPWQPAVLKVHILVAPLLVFSIGLVALRHVWRHFRSKARDGRRSGLLTLVVLGPMIVSGYLIQTMTEEGWLKAMAVIHIGLGLMYGLALLAHQFAAGGRKARATRTEERRMRKRRRRQQRARRDPSVAEPARSKAEGRPQDDNAA